MNLKDYLGKTFISRVEGSEDNGIMGFGGGVSVSPEGIKLNSGSEVPFIVGMTKRQGFVYFQGLRPGQDYKFKVIDADEQIGVLFAKVEQRPLGDLRKVLEDLQARFQKMSALETIEASCEGFLAELGNYAPADPREEKIIAKYLNELTQSVDLAKKRFVEIHDRQRLLSQWDNEMVIERAKPEQMPYLRQLVYAFHKKTTLRPLDFERLLRIFDKSLDRTLVGVVEDRVVASATYDPRTADQLPEDSPKDASQIDFIGLEQSRPEFGKIFIKKVVPYTPLKSAYVVLWQHANFEFFGAMGFKPGELIDVILKNHRGKANVHRAYRFNPGD